MKYQKTKGSLASGHKLTTEAGLEMLKLGGNIYDACVAAAFAAPCTEPLLTSIAGGGILTGFQNGRPFVYDFFVNFPGLSGLEKLEFDRLTVKFTDSEQAFMIGKASSAVPGTLIGLIETHQDLGKLPITEVLAPAIDYAQNGVLISSIQSMTMDLLEPLLSIDSEGEGIFYQNEKRVRTGDNLYNKNYAKFLIRLGKSGPQNFIQNEWKEIILSSFKDLSNINEKDLDNYRVSKSSPLQANLNGHDFYTAPSPCLGGSAVLNLFERINQKIDSTKIDKNLLKDISESLIDFENDFKEKQFQKGTTHISGVDEHHNAVSLSITNGEGSGHYLKGTGIMMNNMLGEDDLCRPDQSDWLPGKRMSSMMAPSIIVKDQRILAIGAGGSKRIRSSLSVILTLMFKYKLSLEAAINFPRLNYDGKQLQFEPNLLNTLEEYLLNNFDSNLWSEPSFYFGGVHGCDGINESYGDPRRDGFGGIVY